MLKVYFQGDPYQIASEQMVAGNKAIDKLVLVPSLSKALVLSGNQHIPLPHPHYNR